MAVLFWWTEATAQVLPLTLHRADDVDFRVLSWNIGGAAIFSSADSLRALVRWTDPDVLLIDEATGESESALRSVVHALRSKEDTTWNVLVGAGGGYQRGAIVTRAPLVEHPEFRHLSFADSSIEWLGTLIPDPVHHRVIASLNSGVAVVGGVLQMQGRRMLAVALDLQCCNADWQEERRRIEIGAIYHALSTALEGDSFDAVLVGGDFNTVNGPVPLLRLLGPYPEPHVWLVPALARHLDGHETWTWDGRGTPFRSSELDFALYSPNTLEVLSSVVVSTEDLSVSELESLGLTTSTSRTLSDHLPLVVDYRWRSID